MAKKVLILSGSPRKGGNSDTLCDEFAKGAIEAGSQVEKIFVAEKNVAYCRGCYSCAQNGGICAIQDDMTEILQKIEEADVIVLASPVYFYSINAQLKTVIDRTVAKWTQIKNKEFYYIITCAENSIEAIHCTLECFRGFAACLNESEEKGVVCATGVYNKGDVLNTSFMQEAYKLGKNVNFFL